MNNIVFKQLPPETIGEMAALGKQSRELQKAGDFAAAEPYLLKIWELIPEPKLDWGNTDSLIYGITDFYRRWGKHDIAKQWIAEVFKRELLPYEYCQYLEAGKTYYEAGEFEMAREYFVKTYRIAKSSGFNGEDPKYLKFLKSKK